MEFSKPDIQFLASLISNPQGLFKIEQDVLVSDFSHEIYYDVYSCIVNKIINSSTINISTIKFDFKNDPVIRELLTELEKEQCVTDDIIAAYNNLLEHTKKISLVKLGKTIVSQATNIATNTTTILATIESSVSSIYSGLRSRLLPVTEIKNNFLTQLKDRQRKFAKSNNLYDVIELPTGLPKLDELTLGFQRGGSWILGGSTSDGKTQLAVQFTNTVISSGKAVLYFMLEDAAENLIQRLCSLKTGIKLFDIKIGNVNDVEYAKIVAAIEELEQTNNLYIDDTTTDINEIITKTKFMKFKYSNLGLVIVDYIGLVTDNYSRSDNREKELSSISKRLLALAKQCNVAFLNLSQVNTNPEQRSTGLPVRNNDVRDSKAITHDAATVLLLYCPDKNDDKKGFSRKHTQLIVTKNRYGQVNKVIDLINHAHVARFIEGTPKNES